MCTYSAAAAKLAKAETHDFGTQPPAGLNLPPESVRVCRYVYIEEKVDRERRAEHILENCTNSLLLNPASACPRFTREFLRLVCGCVRGRGMFEFIFRERR